MQIIFILFIESCLLTCRSGYNDNIVKLDTSAIIVSTGQTIAERYKTPHDYDRIPVKQGSFAEYLRNLPLKPYGTQVRYYNGGNKRSNGIYDGVVDFDLSYKNLQQCADAVIRLRAEYLYIHKQTEKIHFNYTNGFNASYTKWSQGFRPLIQRHKVTWIKRTEPSESYVNFKNYLENVYTYAGTISLSKELISIDFMDMKIGDVFIQAGSPGHAVIVVDMAQNPVTGNKLYILAQSYMPAQDIQILVNPGNSDLSPWYEMKSDDDVIITPQWMFKQKDLKRFNEE